jgi:hypothetical protein
MRRNRLHACDEAEEIHIKLTLDLLARSGLERPEGTVTSVVEPYVDLAKGTDRGADGGAHGDGVLYVERDELELWRFAQVFLSGWIAHGGNYIPSPIGEQPRRRLTDATASPSDDDSFCRVLGH